MGNKCSTNIDDYSANFYKRLVLSLKKNKNPVHYMNPRFFLFICYLISKYRDCLSVTSFFQGMKS